MTTPPTTWSWSDFSPQGIGSSDSIRLPRHGWFALVAFLAGPASVHSAREEREPLRWSSDAGTYGRRPLLPEEVEEIEQELSAYLAIADVAPPPRDVEWRLSLPHDLTEERFWNRVYATFDPVEFDRPGRGPHVAARLRAELSQLLN